jgi:hypothetical protein
LYFDLRLFLLPVLFAALADGEREFSRNEKMRPFAFVVGHTPTAPNEMRKKPGNKFTTDDTDITDEESTEKTLSPE